MTGVDLRTLIWWQLTLPLKWNVGSSLKTSSAAKALSFLFAFNVHGTVHRWMCILYNQRDATYTVFFTIISALHVSGGFSAHHQELIKRYVQPLVLSCFPAVYRWCGWGSTDNNKEHCISCISCLYKIYIYNSKCSLPFIMPQSICSILVSPNWLFKLNRGQLKCDGTRWRTGEEVKGKLANRVGSQYSSHYLGTWCIQHYYRWCAHLGCQ
jgi:hypothetical protein